MVFGGDGAPGISRITVATLASDLPALQRIAWLKPSDNRYDLPCRLRDLEAAPSERATDPDVRRGEVLEDRDRYLRDLQAKLADPETANMIAACLMSTNPLLAENVVRQAVLVQLNAITARPDWDAAGDILNDYRDALLETDGDFFARRILPGWALERVNEGNSSGEWRVRIRDADGALIRIRLPETEELRRGEILNTPQFDALVAARHRLIEHLVTYGIEEGSTGQLPLPGDDDARQALARSMALGFADRARRGTRIQLD